MGTKIRKHPSKAVTLRPDGFRISVFSLLLGTLAINILSLALPVMTTQVYNRILPNPDSGTLPVLITGVCIALFLETILRLSRAYMMGWAGAAYEHRLSCEAMAHVLKSNPRHIHAFGMGEHLHRMAAIGKLKDFYNGYALVTLFELAFLPLFFALIYYIAGPLVIVPAVILGLFTLISLMQGSRLRQALKDRDEADDERFNFLIESLEGIHTIKSFALENFFERRYESFEKKSSLANYKVTQDTAATFDMGTIFSHIMVGAVIFVGAYFVLENNVTTGVLIATLLLSGRMMQPVQRALVLWAKYQNFTLSREKVQQLFNTPLHSPAEIVTEPERQGTLTVSGLHFRYKKQDPWLLKDIGFDVKAGEVVLFTGTDGSGKTTLLHLIAGIYPPAHGHIDVDGMNVSRYPVNTLSRHIGYIRTEGVIFRGTIRDNLTCFGQTDEKDVRELAGLLKVDRDVSRLPSGFDTFLSGNMTDTIPPGLKQRIAMVRALATRPKLILFDNADRALDSEGYALVYSLLAGLKGQTTLILVSDDPNLQSLATCTYHLQQGTLVQPALHPEQVNIKPYRELK